MFESLYFFYTKIRFIFWRLVFLFRYNKNDMKELVFYRQKNNKIVRVTRLGIKNVRVNVEKYEYHKVDKKK